MKIIVIAPPDIRNALTDQLGGIVHYDKRVWQTLPLDSIPQIFLLDYSAAESELPFVTRLRSEAPKIIFLQQGASSLNTRTLQSNLAINYSILGLEFRDVPSFKVELEELLKLSSPILAIQDYVLSSVININRIEWEEKERDFTSVSFLLTDATAQTSTPQFLFRASPKERVIECSVPSLEYLWCASYAYWLFYKRYTNQTSDAEWKIAMQLFEWAEGSIRKRVPQSWPSDLPFPLRDAEPGCDNHAVTQFCLAAAAWILHHELGHISEQHLGPPSERRREEEAADKLATEFVFAKAPMEQVSFRAIGVVMATLILLSFELANGRFERDFYPPSYDRLWNAVKCLEKNEPALGVALSGIMMLLTCNGIPQVALDPNSDLIDAVGTQLHYVSRLF